MMGDHVLPRAIPPTANRLSWTSPPSTPTQHNAIPPTCYAVSSPSATNLLSQGGQGPRLLPYFDELDRPISFAISQRDMWMKMRSPRKLSLVMENGAINHHREHVRIELHENAGVGQLRGGILSEQVGTRQGLIELDRAVIIQWMSTSMSTMSIQPNTSEPSPSRRPP